MMFQQFCVFVSVAILATAAAPSIVEPVAANDDLFELGTLTNRSVIIHTAVFTDRSFRWMGNNAISRVEIRNSGPQPIGPVTVRGGLNDDFVHIVRTNSNQINAVINIFATPHDESFGLKTPASHLMNSTRVTGYVPSVFSYNDTDYGRIRFVEVLDQTNGVGSSVGQISDLNSNTISIRFDSNLPDLPIDYIVNVYGDSFLSGQGGMAFGKLTDDSVLIHNQTVTLDDLNDSGVFVFSSQNATFDLARFTDLTEGNLGRIQGVVIDQDLHTIRANFDRNAVTRYLFQAYGQAVMQPDIVVGELHPTSELLDSNTIRVNGTRALYNLQTDYPIDRIEVMNRRRNHVRTRLVDGSVNGTQVIVLFETDSPQIIRYRVNTYGRLD